ncbi:DUF998 domain-containing protein [Holzapfeliella sp. He02]|uniref:DUF998 domain-containing protein n=1 Tax=Holzapfeliella saturejae TaxID=3082953 RepID=A0ABU8SIT6_9LACO
MSTQTKQRLGSLLSILSVAIILLAQIITEFSWINPRYNPILNWVSDLGVPVVTTYGTHLINSPLYFVMNTGFILGGLIYFVGFLLRKSTVPRTKTYQVAPITYTIGLLLIGIFPGYDWALHMFHPLGALVFLLSGDLLAISFGRIQLKSNQALGRTSIALGVISLIVIPVMFTFSTSGFEGLIERVAIYPVFIAIVIRHIHELRAKKS